MTHSESNRHYEAWVAATGGGPNWEYMAWIEQQKRTWLANVINHDTGTPLFGFTDWLEMIAKQTKSPMTNERKNITQPTDWWAAIAEQMRRDGETNLSRWAGECFVANLDKDLQKKLSERPPANRPKKKPCI